MDKNTCKRRDPKSWHPWAAGRARFGGGSGPLVALFVAALAGCGREEPPASTRPTSPKKPATQGRRAVALAARESALHAHLADNPDDVKAYLELANVYYDTGRPQLAVPAYQEVLKRQPDNPGVRTDLGTCYKRLSKFDLARAEYERVLAKHPGHIQATYNLAVVSELMGDRVRAAELWERVGAMAPGTPIARSALRHAAAARAKLNSTPDEKAPLIKREGTRK